MSPSQVITDKQTTHHGENSERANHQKESECHKPKLSASMSDKKNLVLFATKCEMREVCENPSSVMHYVLLCKDEAPKTNTSHNLPLVLSSLLQEFQDVFPDELPPGLPPLRGIEHRIDLIPGAPLPKKSPYCVNPEETKEIQRQVKHLIDHGHVRESLSPCTVRSFLCQKETVAFARVLIVELSMLSPFAIGIPFYALMICLMNLVVPLYFPKLILKVAIIKYAS